MAKFNRLAKRKHNAEIDIDRIRQAISAALKDGRSRDTVTVEDVKRLRAEVN